MSSAPAMRRPSNASASGRLGVSTVARGTSSPMTVATASSSSSRAPPLATITGSATSGSRGPCAASVCTTVRITGVECSMPVFTQSAPMSASTRRICWAMKAGSTPDTPCTPWVSCAVSAVMAVAA